MIWKIQSEKRRFEEEKQRFGVENAERSELENVNPKNATDLNRGVDPKNATNAITQNWKTWRTEVVD